MVQTVLDGAKILQLKVYEGIRSREKPKDVAASPVITNEMRSNKDLWLDPGIMELKKTDDDFKLLSRAFQGFIICSHVMAFLAGEECLYNNAWPEENKKAANALSSQLVGLKMYKEVKEDAKLEDFAYHKKHPDIIITKGMLEEAKVRFPITLNGSFDDSYANVMDIEDDIRGTRDKKPNFTFSSGPQEQQTSTQQPKEESKPEDLKREENLEVEEPKTEQQSEQPKEEPKPEKEENQEEEPKASSPIFNFDNMHLPPETDFIEVTATQKRDVSAIFDKFIGNRTYQLNRIPSGYIQMVINDKDQIRSVINIDPGLCVGNGYNVVGNVPGNTPGSFANIMVHYTEEDIIRKIFNNPQYVLNPDEITKCMSHMFLNQSIYHWIDMSNMKVRLEKLSKDEFKKLGKKFTFIINSLEEVDKARFRISEWNGIDSFTMISDKKCKSPFPGDTCDITNGIEIQINGDDVGITWPDTKIYKKFTIDDYGLL
ncbi:MAG: hypothetical protein NC548_15665 [Lachnospiraceae bacterium]|nr:hypothetical protein [Lachnospiraceae bacterium]